MMCSDHCVTASLRFAAPPDCSEAFVDLLVPIHDARQNTMQGLLDRDGFLMTPHATSVSDFYNPEEVKKTYYPEVERLVKEMTGATRAIVFSHSIRCLPKADENGRVLRPFKFIHNDYTTTSGLSRVREAFGANGDVLNNHQFSIINVWRPIQGPVQESPLTLCNAQSVASTDLVSVPSQDLSGKFTRIYALAFNPQQAWSYFPNMRREEVLLFKTFDSRGDGRARFTFHSAFDHPKTPPHALPRESAEARAIALFA